mmetsp:Transcript_26076/g.75300  ORF Transcript_26076/g.75300 Transcript_26076/m.75300 type:complete len:355 (+) Transcript_26076:44-1108(+)
MTPNTSTMKILRRSSMRMTCLRFRMQRKSWHQRNMTRGVSLTKMRQITNSSSQKRTHTTMKISLPVMPRSYLMSAVATTSMSTTTPTLPWPWMAMRNSLRQRTSSNSMTMNFRNKSSIKEKKIPHMTRTNKAATPSPISMPTSTPLSPKTMKNLTPSLLMPQLLRRGWKRRKNENLRQKPTPRIPTMLRTSTTFMKIEQLFLTRMDSSPTAPRSTRIIRYHQSMPLIPASTASSKLTGFQLPKIWELMPLPSVFRRPHWLPQPGLNSAKSSRIRVAHIPHLLRRIILVALVMAIATAVVAVIVAVVSVGVEVEEEEVPLMIQNALQGWRPDDKRMSATFAERYPPTSTRRIVPQ